MCVQPPGSAPDARAYWRRQKKVAKEKATPGSASGCARSLALLVAPGSLPELACGSNKASRLPPARLRCSAPRKGTPPASRQTRDGQPEKPAKFEISQCLSAAFGFPLARGRRRVTQKPADEGRGLSEPRSGEFRSALSDAQHREEVPLGRPPPTPSNAGYPRSGRRPRVAFFLATFSWRSKKKYARRSTAKTSASEPPERHQTNPKNPAMQHLLARPKISKFGRFFRSTVTVPIGPPIEAEPALTPESPDSDAGANKRHRPPATRHACRIRRSAPGSSRRCGPLVRWSTSGGR